MEISKNLFSIDEFTYYLLLCKISFEGRLRQDLIINRSRIAKYKKEFLHISQKLLERAIKDSFKSEEKTKHPSTPLIRYRVSRSLFEEFYLLLQNFRIHILDDSDFIQAFVNIFFSLFTVQ